MVTVKRTISKHNGWSPFALVLLAMVTLFPYGWLADNWPIFDRFTGFIFASEAAHVAGHMGLFVLLGTAVLAIFPRLRRQPALYVSLIICLGATQEILQLITFKRRPAGASDLFDLAIDLLAAGTVFAIWYWSEAA